MTCEGHCPSSEILLHFLAAVCYFLESMHAAEGYLLAFDFRQQKRPAWSGSGLKNTAASGLLLKFISYMPQFVFVLLYRQL